jgi:hypothetical protein
MYTNTRKKQLVEEVLKVTNEATLAELETVLKRAKSKQANGKKTHKPLTAHDFSGVWSKKDTALITKAIDESCEQIHADDWK